MEHDKLIATGLNQQQALAYALLIETGGTTPPKAASQLNLSRSNAYKVLDRLVDMGLASRTEKLKKLIYSPTNPTSLAQLAAKQRNLATAQETAVQAVITDLISKYRKHTDQPNIQVVTGQKAVAEAYRLQIKQGQSIHFLRSSADITSMSFDAMSQIRTEPERFGIKRCGITPDLSTKPSRDSKLERTWVRGEDYAAPVEWSVAGESLLVVVFGDEPHAITIESPIIAAAFQEILQLLTNCLRTMPYYNRLPRAQS